MSLPKLTVPTYRIVLPISKKEISVRPFLMREEKMLMIAFESKDAKHILTTMAKAIQDCVSEPINVEELSMIDAEYLIIKMKSYSRGESIDLTMRCANPVEKDGKIAKCGCLTDITVGLDDLDRNIDLDKIESGSINLTDDIGIVLRPPRFACLETILNPTTTEAEHAMNILVDSIQSIWNKDEVFMAAEEELADITAFVEEMDRTQFQKIEKYLKSLPELFLQTEFKCPSCDHEETVNIRNITDFFV